MLGNILAGVGRFGAAMGGYQGVTPLEGEGGDNFAGIENTLAWAIWDITWPILTVLAGLGTIFAIWLGVRLATAQDESKRKEAKAQLVWAILAVVIIVGIIGIFGAVLAATSPRVSPPPS